GLNSPFDIFQIEKRKVNDSDAKVLYVRAK
ncbi:unnamed protein product, partial [marine sediment metagenome]